MSPALHGSARVRQHRSAPSWGVHRKHGRSILRLIAGAMLVLMSLAGLQLSPPGQAFAATGYADSIVTKALSFVGQNGGEACKQARTGDKGGQCRAFVNCVVWLASGGRHNLGKYPNDYFKALAEYGDEVTELSELRRGDIVQRPGGAHTFIIVGPTNVKSTFDVVDSNHDEGNNPEMVMAYPRKNVTLSDGSRAFRMRSISANGSTKSSESSGQAAESGNDSRHTSVMNKDWPLWASPTSRGSKSVVATSGSTVSMQCWTTGVEKDGTKKWFKIRLEDSSDEGFVPANTVKNQWRSSPRCT